MDKSIPLLILLVFLGLVVPGSGDVQELKLNQHLFGGARYDASVRPVSNYSQPLLVTFGLSLHHIIDVDEKNQILTTSCWLTQIWNDSHLTWNPGEFGGIGVIRVPLDRLWKPDIILYNNADSQYTSSVINTNLIVSSEGTVTWLSHGIYKSSCDINTEFFPFDIQNCTMKFASWTFDGYQLDLKIEGEESDTGPGDISNYHANGEFDLLGVTANRHIQVYSCCPEPYPDIEYTIGLRRRPLFYVFNLIVPCFLINGMALLVFFVPSDSGEKVTLGISALLSMTVFLMTIRESLPPTENTPLISLYYGVSICIVTFASAFAVFTLNIHHRGFRGVAVPRWLRFLVLKFFAKVLLMQTGHEEEMVNDDGDLLKPVQPEVPDDLRETFQELRDQLNGLHPSLGYRLDSESVRKFDDSRVSPRFYGRGRVANVSLVQHRGNPDGSDIEERFQRISGKILESLARCENKTAVAAAVDRNQVMWKMVALVMDRLLFWLFLIITVSASTTILLSSPYILN